MKEAFEQLSRVEKLVRNRQIFATYASENGLLISESDTLVAAEVTIVADSTTVAIQEPEGPVNPSFDLRKRKRSGAEDREHLGSTHTLPPALAPETTLWQATTGFMYRSDGRLLKNSQHYNEHIAVKVVENIDNTLISRS
jgi:hypothetical protein